LSLDKSTMLLYAVTDRAWLNGSNLAEKVEQAIRGGATFVQLREKDISDEEFLTIAREVKVVTDRYMVPYVINDNVNVAIKVNADGVHLGQGDEQIRTARVRLGPNKIIGISAHTVEEALLAQENGADYIGVGAIFNTTTKPDANTVSMETLKKICSAVAIPVVAIGGITKHNILELSGTGVDGVAVVSALFAQQDVENAARELLALSRRMAGYEVRNI
jgi:thiamine-phosphate pyrophosphorylase